MGGGGGDAGGGAGGGGGSGSGTTKMVACKPETASTVTPNQLERSARLAAFMVASAVWAALKSVIVMTVVTSRTLAEAAKMTTE